MRSFCRTLLISGLWNSPDLQVIPIKKILTWSDNKNAYLTNNYQFVQFTEHKAFRFLWVSFLLTRTLFHHLDSQYFTASANGYTVMLNPCQSNRFLGLSPNWTWSLNRSLPGTRASLATIITHRPTGQSAPARNGVYLSVVSQSVPSYFRNHNISLLSRELCNSNVIYRLLQSRNPVLSSVVIYGYHNRNHKQFDRH